MLLTNPNWLGRGGMCQELWAINILNNEDIIYSKNLFMCT